MKNEKKKEKEEGEANERRREKVFQKSCRESFPKKEKKTFLNERGKGLKGK